MRSRMLTIGLVVAGVWSASIVTAWAEDPKSMAEVPPRAAAIFACPMHPQIQATFPGSCPICRMALKAKGATNAAETTPMNHADHQGMSMGSMNMGGMDMGAMSCPQCAMGMQGMSMKASPAATATPSKIAPAGYRSTGGHRCGC
ncbi:MAG: hypothetical protein JNK76_26975 [Planctomycetales bacterium]|nr:hypothetical protein [Planctomycetales bacterium]